MLRGRGPLTWLALAALLLAAGCASLHVDADWDPRQDFRDLQRWTFAPIPGAEGSGTDPRLEGDLLHRRVRSAIEAELSAKDYVRDDARPDFWVVYHVAAGRRVDVETAYDDVPYGRWGVNLPVERGTTYEPGTLVVDVLLPGDGELVWRGSVETGVVQGLEPEERDRRVRDAVRAVLARFPPSP